MGIVARNFRMFFAVVAVIAVSGCVNVPSPSVNLLSKDKVPFYINSVTVELVGKTKSPTLLAKVQRALAKWPSVGGPNGRPAKLTVQINRFIQVSAAQALLFGGSSTILYSVEVTNESDNTKVYQIDLIDRVGYAPGGIIAVVAVLATDEENELAKALAKHVLATIFKPYNISVAKSALEEFSKIPEPAKKEAPEPIEK